MKLAVKSANERIHRGEAMVRRSACTVDVNGRSALKRSFLMMEISKFRRVQQSAEDDIERQSSENAFTRPPHQE